MTAKFKKYAFQIVANAKALAKELKKYDFHLIAGGTNTHLILIDLQNKGLIGNLAAEAIEETGIVLNRNAVPFDSNPPFYPSGIRLGTPGITSRGMKEPQMRKIAAWINEAVAEVVKIKQNMGISFEQEKKKSVRKEIIKKCQRFKKIKKEIKKLCQKFPIKNNY